MALDFRKQRPFPQFTWDLDVQRFLARRVDLLIGYVDLNGRAHLADLRQRAHGGEVSPVRPVEAFLPMFVLAYGPALHPEGVESLEELHLQPGGYHPLR